MKTVTREESLHAQYPGGARNAVNASALNEEGFIALAPDHSILTRKYMRYVAHKEVPTKCKPFNG